VAERTCTEGAVHFAYGGAKSGFVCLRSANLQQRGNVVDRGNWKAPPFSSTSVARSSVAIAPCAMSRICRPPDQQIILHCKPQNLQAVPVRLSRGHPLVLESRDPLGSLLSCVNPVFCHASTLQRRKGTGSSLFFVHTIDVCLLPAMVPCILETGGLSCAERL